MLGIILNYKPHRLGWGLIIVHRTNGYPIKGAGFEPCFLLPNLDERTGIEPVLAQTKGLEPLLTVLETAVLPLNYTRCFTGSKLLKAFQLRKHDHSKLTINHLHSINKINLIPIHHPVNRYSAIRYWPNQLFTTCAVNHQITV